MVCIADEICSEGEAGELKSNGFCVWMREGLPEHFIKNVLAVLFLFVPVLLFFLLYRYRGITAVSAQQFGRSSSAACRLSAARAYEWYG